VAGRQLFVVADGAAVLADPGEGPLDHPAARQDGEGVQVIGPADDLQRDAQGGSPGGEPVRLVTGVGPGQPDARAGAAQIPQQRAGGVAVLHAGGGDDHIEQQPRGVHGDVPLAAVDLLGGIPAPGGLGHGVGGAHRLGVNDGGGGLGVPPGRGPDSGAQLGVQPG
jgi:hypothetical protein